MNDIIIEILEDGRVKIQTGEFDAATHRNADQLVNGIIAGMGGKVEKQKSKKHRHAHHDHEHEHEKQRG